MRFSKDALVKRLTGIIDYHEREHGFNSHNGYDQVMPRGATEHERKLVERAYQFGRYSQALDLWESYNRSSY